MRLLALLLLSPAHAALRYDKRFEFTLNSTELFTLLKTSLADSSSEGSVWPEEYSTVSGLIAEGGILHEVIFGYTEMSYVLSNYREGASDSGFTYTPLEGEFFSGTSHIVVQPTSSGGSTLSWRGEYDLPIYSPFWWATRIYIWLFYPALVENIRAYERKCLGLVA